MSESHGKNMISLTEEMVLSPPKGCEWHTFLADEKWRYYRIEYGNHCSCPEGSIWLPAWMPPEVIENILNQGDIYNQRVQLVKDQIEGDMGGPKSD